VEVSGGNFSTTGDISGNTLHINNASIDIAGNFSTTGDISGNDVTCNTLHVSDFSFENINVTGDISGNTLHINTNAYITNIGNITTNGYVNSSTLTVNNVNIDTSGNISTTADIVSNTLHVNDSFIDSSGNFSTIGNITVNSITASGDISGNALYATSTTIDNVGNIDTNGIINCNSLNLNSTTIDNSGNILTSGNITTNKNITSYGNILTFGDISGNTLRVNGVLIANTGALTLPAGTTSKAPLRLTTGTNLTTAAAGSIEYDASGVYYSTTDTTQGRGLLPSISCFKLTSDGTAITSTTTPGSNFYGSNSNIPLVTNGFYEIEAVMYFLKTTATTITWVLTFSTAQPTYWTINYEASATGGIVTSAAASQLFAQIYNPLVTTYTLTTGSLTTAVNHYVKFKIYLQNSTNSSLKITVFNASASSITPRAGSYWKCMRLPSSNNSAYIA